MSGLTSWIVVVAVTFCLAFFWVIYLIKLVINDEELQERIRSIRRQLEEERRAMEDKMRRRREEHINMQQGVKEKLQGSKQVSPASAPEGATEA